MAVGEAVLFAKMEKYRQDDCTGTMYDIDLDASGECLPANNERYICNATGVLYEKFNSSGSNSDCSNALEWGDFYPFNSCSQGYRYLDCVDLPAVTLETFTDTTCTTKEGESIQPIVDCTLIDGAWIKMLGKKITKPMKKHVSPLFPTCKSNSRRKRGGSQPSW